MVTLYNPCNDCKQKNKECWRCGYKASLTNYQRALNKIRELSVQLGKSITILK